jgi:hypothetical protein
MNVRFFHADHLLLTLTDLPREAPELARLPGRGEQFALADPLTGTRRRYTVIQVECLYGMDPARGRLGLTGIDIYVTMIVAERYAENPIHD